MFPSNYSIYRAASKWRHSRPKSRLSSTQRIKFGEVDGKTKAFIVYAPGGRIISREPQYKDDPRKAAWSPKWADEERDLFLDDNDNIRRTYELYCFPKKRLP